MTDADDFLLHYGVKGMKWGVRKSKEETGLSRAQGATIDRNDRHIERLRRQPIFKKHYNKLADKREDQNDRIKDGELFVRDYLSIYGQTSLAGLYISVRPK
jgi:hypothetical protein